MQTGHIVVGTAGWNVPRDHAAQFPEAGSHLSRYAGRLRGAEINSSFYRPHRPSTYARWATSVPATFRFAVKVPRAITHERALADITQPLDAFLGEATALGDALGPLLVQLPPSRAFDRAVVTRFFATLRERHDGPVVLEPRHASWFTPDVDALLTEHRIAGVAADPARVPAAAHPSGYGGVVYYRLHGSPQIYRSSYDPAFLDRVALALRDACAAGADTWCIFDNTASGAAAANALALQERLAG